MLDDTATGSYQTAPLTHYGLELQHHAATLWDSVCELLPPSKRKKYDGSYSLFASSSQTAAKILIFQSNKGKIDGDFPPLQDGVYALFRADGALGDRIFGDLLPSEAPVVYQRLERGNTIGVAPAHDKRFVYLLVSPDQLEEIAHALALCSRA